MKIRTFMILTGGVLLILLIAAWSVYLFNFTAQWKARESRNLAVGILRDVQQLSTLTQEYELYGSERAKIQWLAKQAGLATSIRDADFSEEQDKAAIAGLQAQNAQISQDFAKLMEIRSDSNAGSMQAELGDAVLSHIMLVLQDMTSQAVNLSDTFGNKVAAAQLNTFLLMNVSISLVTGYLAFISITLWRRLIRPLNMLKTGTDRIAKGNLEYRVGISTKDEIGDLSRSFDTMAGKLHDSYQALRMERDALDVRVLERTRDLQEREQSLKLLTSRQEAILAAVPDIIAEVDNNKTYTWANPAAIRFFGEHMLGKEAASYFEGEQDTYIKVQPLFTGDPNVIYVESWQRRRDGERRLLAWWCRMLQDKDGNVKGALSSAQDITERKLAEQEIRRLNAELEQRVQERTAQLAAANRELEAFAYSVSHDLRAPLRGIDGWSLALKEDCKDKLNEKESEYLDLVRSETQTMGRLIDDLLMFSRQSRAEMRQEPLDMTAMVEAIVSRLQRQNPSIQAEFIIRPGLTALGDAGLIDIALTNLLNNAVKFSSKRPGAVIEFGRVEQDRRKPFFVRDNGAGFDMAYADKLFGVFRRMHKSSEFPGTGIGLASVQRIINRHGGRVWAEAKLNEGATFYFTLKEAI
jgi:PAS domain S-box-containing protein